MTNIENLPFEKRTRQIKKKQNREVIINAAHEVFAKKGYDNSSVREIIGLIGYQIKNNIIYLLRIIKNIFLI
jgi:hypothetical protein